MRAGSANTKTVDGLDINGLFAAVCIHGFPYKIIDIDGGETAEYVASIVKTFRKEFKNATLILFYDIACILEVLQKVNF